MKKSIVAAVAGLSVAVSLFAAFRAGELHATREIDIHDAEILDALESAYHDGKIDGYWEGKEEGKKEGFQDGMEHAIVDCEMFVLSLPERNEKGGYDESEITVYMDIDGDIHEYGANIG